ncbi:MAG: bifunctional folylpolyglutamate synthase/dihydrofolate synthase [Eubacterium sp.]|nr:bifunctional folylpolyglutamate synthase/dihydrofolate synthase [Eubacterium sp.]
MMDRYSQILEYINSTPKFTKKTDHRNIKELLSRLGNPQDGIKAVHIAGTNGKGSVAKMISGFLINSGYKTGLFTSPHLVKMNERIQINGVEISDDELVALFDKINKSVDFKKLLDETSDKENELQHPAFFELLFLIACLYFKEKDCDYVVYETGLGGRLDATNIISPEISIITSIGMDHMQYLGNSIESIAGEKAGIIKTGIPVVYNTGEEVADKVIEEKAEKLGSPYYNVKSYKLKTDIILEDYDHLYALYQKENAKTAITAFEIMNQAKVICKNIREIVDKTLKSFNWPGRMEFLTHNILIDGAHNVDAMNKYVESVKAIQEKDGWSKLSLIFAVSSDKDYDNMIKILVNNLDFTNVYVSEINSDRRQDAGVEAQIFYDYMRDDNHFSVKAFKDLESAWNVARKDQEDDTLLLVVGSLYMVGELKSIFTDENS